MDASQHSNKPAFELLIELHGKEIHAYLWRMLGEAEDAQDCLQEAFLRAYRAYARLEKLENPRAWLYRIAGNVARTQLKRRALRDSRELQLDWDTRQPSLSIEAKVERKAWLDHVRRAVEDLPFRQRQALLLRKYQGLRYAEIAVVLDCSQDAARAHVYQALKKLRAQFAGWPISLEEPG